MALQDNNIPNRRILRLTRFVVNKNGVWFFASPGNYSTPSIKNSVKYWKIPTDFGITRDNTVDPSQVYAKGLPGDCLVLHLTGEYSIIPAAEFDLLNSTKNSK